jgi:phosphonate transport system substrate-binding protein
MRASHLLVALFFLAGAQLAKAVEPLRFAPLPMENRESTVKAFYPLLAYLQKQLRQPVELVFYEKNSEIAAALKSGAVDFAYLGPLPYVSLRQQGAAVEPLVFFREPNGQARYRCALVAFAGDVTQLQHMKGKRIALTQPLSTCGYLGGNAMMLRAGGISLQDMQYRYLGSHEAVALAVVSGDAEIGSIKDEFALKFAPLGLQTLAYSDWLPATGLFASRKRLDDTALKELRRILLATPEKVYRTWGGSIRHGMVIASDTDFDTLRALGDPADIPQRSGN